MLKILFINPDFDNHHPPLGIGYLSSYLKKHLHVPCEIVLHDEMEDAPDLAAVLDEYKPDLIAISIVTPTWDRSLSLCRRIRAMSPAPIVAGGPHITALPAAIAGTPIDVAVIGEGEETFLELVRCYQESRSLKNDRIAGILYVEEGAVVRTHPRPLIEDIHSIPAPDRSLFRMRDHYLKPQRMAHGLYARGTSMMPSRGCPYGRCSFCSSTLTWGTVPRIFSPRAVADEIESLLREYDSRFLIFLDDNFTTRFAWLQSLHAELEQRGLQKTIRFDCESIAAFLDPRRAELLREMGCIRIEFGFESGCERVLHALKSGRSKVAHNEKAIAICRQNDMQTLGNAIFGYMDETPEEFDESVAWYLNQPIDFIAPHIYTPYPGTSGWEECVSRGILDPKEVDWREFVTSLANNNLLTNRRHFAADDFLARYKKISTAFYQRNRTIIVEDGLPYLDRIALYDKYLGERKSENLSRMGPGIPPAKKASIPTLDRVATRAFAAFKKGGRFLRARRKGWLLRDKLAPWMPLIHRAPAGGRFLVWKDVLGRRLYHDEELDGGELAFLTGYLDQGMVVLDIGAHQGFYAIFFSKKIGKHGRVFAFEPSPRERRRLKWNLLMNRCRNVQVESLAVTDRAGEEDFFICLGMETGCNSLRNSPMIAPCEKIRVATTGIDGYFADRMPSRLDLVKIDAEGAELNVLKGGAALLKKFRPALMCELADSRTRAWGYPALEIYSYGRQLGYRWFSVSPGGGLLPCPEKTKYHENLIALPEESMSASSGAGA